ncbi:NHL repeat-containing protein [Flavobacterium sedimenticola]|uniref:ATP/GTP-binding protein n=1 Tax=Flavobacterium sedimenticola TaxID=3043286 RepID=A0ABT6XP01_9FLAO|nr:hypothetical protein [Flavobacterium sedimenticola]MDI9256801.1 hypothetical protein [Flavobacterium sedimenticola]
MKNSKRIVSLFLLGIPLCLEAQNTKTISGFGHIESIATDGTYIYAADIGKELLPVAKDGDGKIIKLDKRGNIIAPNIYPETLHAPKGLAIHKEILFVNDIDRIIAINLKNGQKVYEISMANHTAFLNDIAVWDNHTLFVSATDKNKLFKINLTDKTVVEIKIAPEIAGINGLFCHKKASRLYVNGFGSDNKPNGVLGYIDLTTNTFTKLTNLEGYYDGLAIYKDMLVASNWVSFENKGMVMVWDIFGSQRSKKITALPVGGPADFIIYKDVLIVPAMLTGEIHFIRLDSDLLLQI